MSEPQVKTEEKKQHFDDIYVAETPVPFKERIIDALDYISDDFNRQTFDRLILPWAEQQAAAGRTLNYVDLCCCFGNTTMAAIHDMDVDAIRANWASEEACKTVTAPRRLPVKATGIDISGNALAYGKSAGLFDETFEADLNQPEPGTQAAIEQAMADADIVISTASLVYLDPPAIEKLIRAFASTPREGYMLVNFLNPFALEKADATKRLLLEHLEFVGSTASRHRRLSPLEQENYPGEEWALLEIWVLRRHSA
ncbi:MAG: class I SAM-dependent methyltransferase [Thioalkalivibrio sp.]|nr:class I SAM-dependent methyltransferase [Thioalkalivibrio sp.]